MKFTPFLLIGLVGSLLGCSASEGPQALVATEKLQTYSTPDGKEAFVINKGDICAAGKKEITKQYQYIEVVCPGKGYAWVITGDNFKIESKTNHGSVK